MAIDILFPPNLLVTFSMTIGKLCLSFSLSLSRPFLYLPLHFYFFFSCPFPIFLLLSSSLFLSFCFSLSLYLSFFPPFPPSLLRFTLRLSLFLPLSLFFFLYSLCSLPFSLYFFLCFVYLPFTPPLPPFSLFNSLFAYVSFILPLPLPISLCSSSSLSLFSLPSLSLSLYFLYRYIINFRVASFDLQRWTWQITLSMGGLLTTNFNRAYFNTRTPQYTALALLRLVYSLSPVTW